jgi:hypothetical protein
MWHTRQLKENKRRSEERKAVNPTENEPDLLTDRVILISAELVNKALKLVCNLMENVDAKF